MTDAFPVRARGSKSRPSAAYYGMGKGPGVDRRRVIARASARPHVPLLTKESMRSKTAPGVVPSSLGPNGPQASLSWVYVVRK